MERQNVTLSLPKSALRKAKLMAVERNQSLSSLLTQLILEAVDEDEQYRIAMHRQLLWLSEGFDMGTLGKADWSRDDLHER